MRVIVCGGRDYNDVRTVWHVLGSLDPNTTLVHGACRTGLDALADAFWTSHHPTTEPERHPADWDRHGRAAGPMRNTDMAAKGATICIAFPGGRGTENMVEQAKLHSIPVLRVDA
jgi:hypothetical protein